MAELQRVLSQEQGNPRIVLDLRDIVLIDRDAVKFMANCEADRDQIAKLSTLYTPRGLAKKKRIARREGKGNWRYEGHEGVGAVRRVFEDA